MQRDPFSNPFQGGTGQPFSDLFKRPAGGGSRGPRKSAPSPEEEPEPLEPEAGPSEETQSPDKAVLKNPKWEAEDVGFNEETEVSVEATLPEAHAHKTRVVFELFAKIPSEDDPEGGAERISKGEGTIEGGKAKGKIPVYMPQHRDQDGNLLSRVEYYFTAKHSMSELLKDETVVKIVDRMADRLIETRVLEDVNFATGKSFPQASQADGLKALGGTVKTWRDEHPEGKVAVFGHADAVGREMDNKSLSERRARSIHAFLAKDPKAWEALYGEEKWGLASTQELLKHLGHDPGAIDGVDGPKTRAAVKDFQAGRGLATDGVAGPMTREALYLAYMEACEAPGLKEKEFDTIDGKPFAGCSEYNLVEKVEGACGKNRRVTVCLLKSNRNFPIQYPCKHGDIAPCKSQVGRKGERRTPGFGCRFYDDLIREAGGGQGGSKVLNLSLGMPYSEDRLSVRKFIFECAGQTISGDVPEDGKLAIQVPAGAAEATLKLDPEAEGGGLTWTLALSEIPPVEDVKGMQIRLNNLGFICGAEDGILGKRTRVGLRTFQQRHGLPVTGEADEPTLAKIKEAYGG